MGLQFDEALPIIKLRLDCLFPPFNLAYAHFFPQAVAELKAKTQKLSLIAGSNATSRAVRKSLKQEMDLLAASQGLRQIGRVLRIHQNAEILTYHLLLSLLSGALAFGCRTDTLPSSKFAMLTKRIKLKP